MDVERADALLSDLLEEVASVANAQLREPPLIPAAEVVGDARALEQSRSRLSQVDGGRGLVPGRVAPGLRVGARCGGRREGRERRQAADGV